jgi:NlpC/P60 family putative phage cell wall peptidase
LNIRSIADLRQAVVAEARQWLGTPYHHHGRVRGAGVDCAMLVAEVYERVGAAPHVDPGNYPHDWHLHQREERLLDQLKACGAGPVPVPEAGDVALFRCGRTWSHAGIVQGPGLPVIHAYLGRGVVETMAGEAPLSRFPCSYWSLWA